LAAQLRHNSGTNPAQIRYCQTGLYAVDRVDTAYGDLQEFAMPMPSLLEAHRNALVAVLLAASSFALAGASVGDAAAAEKLGTIAVPAGRAGTVNVPVTIDRATIDTSGAGNPHSIKLVGQRGDHIVELLDAYPSKPQGMSRCQAGSETWFRVIDTATRKQLYARLVDSCLNDQVQAADPLITRSDDGSKIVLHGLYSSVALSIGADGTVSETP
jgi:hypothetical protein